MKKLIEKFWEDMFDGITTQDKSKILQSFTPDASYKFRTADKMYDVALEDMAASCLGYKDTLDCKYFIERIDELADGSWVSVITCSDNKKPYFTVSYFKFKDGRISDLTEYYGDF